MSRTYRRKNGQRGYRKIWATHDWERLPGTYIFVRVRKTGKELKKSLARYHSDHDYNSSPSVWFRQNEWSKIRAKEKQELAKWFKDSDYEVQMVEHPRWPWWD